MSTPLPHVEKVLPQGWQQPSAGVVVLDYEDRYRRRITLESDQGLRFLLSFDEPKLLMEGDGLLLSTGSVVEVMSAREALVEITCETPAKLVQIAWHLGNRHLPTQLMDGKLRIRDDHVIVDMVTKLGAHIVHLEDVFQPEGGAYGIGRTQGHSHGHSHDHDHSHGHSHD